MAGLTEVPVIIKELDDRAFTEIALIENLQREDLNAVEEAEGYKTLMETYGLTQEQVAETVGKSRPAVTNAMRLLGLDDASREALRRGIISAGHARALLSVEDADLRGRMLLAASDGASVRELERMAAASKKTAAAPRKKTVQKNSFFSEVELSLRDTLHRKVEITPEKDGRGTITLEFYSKDELADFARRLAGSEE